ncbi:MAG: MarC family protein [Planctomycetes bacterium]|nr:MarC family protein [Planctomycetota bacterium]
MIAAFFGAFGLAFIPLLVAIDALGVLPIFLGLTEDLDARNRKRVARQAVLTAFFGAAAFTGGGRWILQVVGVTLADFKIAGGVVLLVISVLDLVTTEKERRKPMPSVGVVPLGMPLLAGPAVLTTLLIQIDAHGPLPTVAALTANMALVWIVLRFAGVIHRLLGTEGARAASKISSVILAAFAVMMIRVGVTEILAGPG